MNRSTLAKITTITLLVLVGTCPAFAATVLQNNVAVTNVSGTNHSIAYYSISVPAGQTKLTITTSGGSGDCDIYVKFNGTPSTSTYDYKSSLNGNNETITINNPASGTWYIMLYGYSAYSGLFLLAHYEAATSYVTLNDGQTVTNISGSNHSVAYYRISVPAGQTKLTITTSGGSGNCDIYVKFNGTPSTSTYDYKSSLSNNNETITINNPASGTWYIMLYGYAAYSGLSLLAHYESAVTPPAETILTNGLVVTGLADTTLGGQKFFKINVPANMTTLKIKVSGGIGDCDLYVKRASRPTISVYDYKSCTLGNEETVTKIDPLSGDWYIMLRTYYPYWNVSLCASDFKLEQGDLLLRKGTDVISIAIVLAEISQLGTTAKYSHAAIYVGKDSYGISNVAEMLSDGKKINTLSSFIDSAEKVDAKRLVGIGTFGTIVANKAQAYSVPYATEQIKVLLDVAACINSDRCPVDLNGLLNNADTAAGGKKKMICSEMCAWAYYDVNPSLAVSVTPWPKMVSWGISTLSRNRLYDYTTPNMLYLSPSFTSVGSVK